MIMNDNLTININILDRSYAVRVRVEDKEIFDQVSRSIEALMRKYASKDSMIYKDKQDLLAMALIETTISLIKTEDEREKDREENLSNDKRETELVDRLKDIDRLLSKVKEREEEVRKVF